MSEYGFIFDTDKCTACYGCTVACKSWRDVETGLNMNNESFKTVRYRRIEKRWQGEYPQVNFRSYSVSCQHCAEPWCMAACPVKAISKNAITGAVTVDQSTCIGCRSCLQACPFGVPQFSVHPQANGQLPKMQKCDMCIGLIDPAKEDPPCVATCNTKAFSLKKISSEDKKLNEQGLIKALAT